MSSELHGVSRENITRLSDCIIHQLDITVKDVAANMFNETAQIANRDSLNLKWNEIRVESVRIWDFLIIRKCAGARLTRIIYLENSQLQEGNQNCTQQSLSAFYCHPTLLNDAMIPQRDEWNTRCRSRARAVVLK